MTQKVLGRAGISLADVYDVEGSIAGIDELDVRSVKGVHELGAQIHSERVVTHLIRMASGALATGNVFNITAGAFPQSINRLLDVAFLVAGANTTEIANATVSIRDTDLTREIPIHSWDDAVDPEVPIRWDNDGAGAAQFLLLRPLVPFVPQLITRTGDALLMPELVFRGIAATVATTVEMFAVIQLIRPDRGAPPAGEPSSHGLPIPSW